MPRWCSDSQIGARSGRATCHYPVVEQTWNKSDERWPTAGDVRAAGIRYAEQIPGYEPPVAYGVGRLDADEIIFGHVNDVGGTHLLPAVILAFVCGHSAGTATYRLSAETFAGAIRLLAPAEACMIFDHPNLWSWRTLVEASILDATFVAVFVSDVGAPPVDRYDSAFRMLLSVPL
jgi:hypothetical protein